VGGARSAMGAVGSVVGAERSAVGTKGSVVGGTRSAMDAVGSVVGADRSAVGGRLGDKAAIRRRLSVMAGRSAVLVDGIVVDEDELTKVVDLAAANAAGAMVLAEGSAVLADDSSSFTAGFVAEDGVPVFAPASPGLVATRTSNGSSYPSSKKVGKVLIGAPLSSFFPTSSYSSDPSSSSSSSSRVGDDDGVSCFLGLIKALNVGAAGNIFLTFASRWAELLVGS
jgi:hypothetical protein